MLYNNTLLLFPLELKKIKHEISEESDWYEIKVVFYLWGYCVCLVWFFGLSSHRAVSAMGFTVLVILNKLLTLAINLFVWDKHTTFVGTLRL